MQRPFFSTGGRLVPAQQPPLALDEPSGMALLAAALGDAVLAIAVLASLGDWLRSATRTGCDAPRRHAPGMALLAHGGR